MYRVWMADLPPQMKVVILAIWELSGKAGESGHLSDRVDLLPEYTGMTGKEVSSWLTECEIARILGRCDMGEGADRPCYHISDGEWSYTRMESITEWVIRQTGLSDDERALLTVMVQEYDLSRDVMEINYDDIASLVLPLDRVGYLRLIAGLVEKRVITSLGVTGWEERTLWRVPYLSSRRPSRQPVMAMMADHAIRESRRKQALNPTQIMMEIGQDLLDRGFDLSKPPPWMDDEMH